MRCLSAIVVLIFCCLVDNTDAQDRQESVAATQRAVGHIQSGELAEAEAILREVTKSDDEYPRAWYFLGYTLHTAKKYDEAIEVYTRAKRFDPIKPVATYNIACIYAVTGKREQAYAELEAAIKLGAVGRTQLQSDSELDSLRNDERFKRLIPEPLSDDELFVEPTQIIHMFYGENANDEFGWVARRVGDVDKDGAQDFVATAPSFGGGKGKAYIYSSRSGDLLFTHTGALNERLGNGAAGAGDVNGDEVPDVILGAPGNTGGSSSGNAYVVSGVDGQVLLTLSEKGPGDRFGYKVCGIGDIDGDNHADVAVGAIAGNGDAPTSGVVYGYSGRTGERLFALNGEATGDKFGSALAGWDQQPGSLLVVGAQDAGENDRGAAYVYRFVDAKPEPLFIIESDENNVELGQMFVSFPGDLNDDTVPDVYVSDFGSNAAGPGAGSIYVHSGADGERILAIHGSQPREGFGTSPSDAGDVNNDGFGDLIVGAWQNREGAVSGGKVYLYSGKEGKLLRTWTCRESGDTFGFDAVGIGDVDKDGSIDFLLTSAWSSAHAPKAGRVLIVSGTLEE